MDLSSELLMDFFDQARNYAKKRSTERRKGGRVALSANTKILVSGDATDALAEATACNLSTTGIALLVQRPLTKGMEFALRLPRANGSLHWVRCEVMRWQASANGACQVGAKFCDIVNTDSGELPVLIDPDTLTSADDKNMATLLKRLVAIEKKSRPAPSPATNGTAARPAENPRAQRVPIKFFSTATLMESPLKRRSIRILLQDISTSGVAFQCPAPCPIGSCVAFMLRFSDQKAKAILTRVVRSKQIAPDHYQIGAQMLEACVQPPWIKEVPNQWLSRIASEKFKKDLTTPVASAPAAA